MSQALKMTNLKIVYQLMQPFCGDSVLQQFNCSSVDAFAAKTWILESCYLIANVWLRLPSCRSYKRSSPSQGNPTDSGRASSTLARPACAPCLERWSVFVRDLPRGKRLETSLKVCASLFLFKFDSLQKRNNNRAPPSEQVCLNIVFCLVSCGQHFRLLVTK